jgi:hypothetical protein
MGRVGCSVKHVGDPGEGLGSKGERQLGTGLAEELQALEHAVLDEGLVEVAVPQPARRWR